MMRAAAFEVPGASVAFDRMAGSYDAVFTESAIGRAQRGVVWDALKRAFRPGDRVLELNCGTGEDALFLASRGISVMACDASAGMIEVAERRKSLSSSDGPLEFRVLRNEDLALLASVSCFDGALSNFSGLNCVEDPRQVALDLERLVKPGGSALLCISTRICLWEIAWYGVRGNFKKAFRRVRGRTVARLDGLSVPVWYPTIRCMRQVFSPWFRLRSIRAVGLFVPPSYVESWARKHPRVLAALQGMDRLFAAWPLLRGAGDHVLLEFTRLSSQGS
jgi:ubiquinone/menaquinone biosynthesis C-methylase UbiE